MEEALISRPQGNSSVRRAVGLFLVLAAMLTAIVYPVLRSYEESRIEVIKAWESGYLLSAKEVINRDFFEAVGDLGVVTHLPSLRDYLSQQQSWRRNDVARILRELAENFGRYDSIAVLDTHGRELLRIDRVGEESIIVPADQLKDQSDCACFEQAIKRTHGGIYVSRISLMPDSAEATSQKPIIYFARAVANDSGAPLAVVVFVFHAREMLTKLRRISGNDSSLSVSMVINKEGYWLSNSNTRDEVEKLVLDKEEESFARQFAKEWTKIRNQEQGEITNEKGLFLFATVYPLAQKFSPGNRQREAWLSLFSAEEERSYYAKLVRWVPSSSLSATSFINQPAGRLIIGAAYAFLVVISVAVVYAMEKKRREEDARRRAAEMELQSYTDSLTAVWNRRYFHEVASRELARNKRNNDPLILLMLDIDHFKRVNDTYGHQTGDIVLKEFCHTVHDTLREIDILARLGGEEFVALLPNTSAERGEVVANRVREAIANSKIVLPNGKELSITVSIGMSCLPTSLSNLDEILNDADLALYEAKQQGRNRVCLSSSCRVERVLAPRSHGA